MGLKDALLLCLLSTEALAQGTAKGDKELGQYLSSECVTCHQLSGKTVGSIPPIVGWPENQFLAVMAAYKNKDRDNNVMQTIAGKLKDDEVAALAAYFGALKPQK
ncbi:MAG: c-type cytochrome [Beijerinckiaceae bacterium]